MATIKTGGNIFEAEEAVVILVIDGDGKIVHAHPSGGGGQQTDMALAERTFESFPTARTVAFVQARSLILKS